jgi:hypothetical protein
MDPEIQSMDLTRRMFPRHRPHEHVRGRLYHALVIEGDNASLIQNVASNPQSIVILLID